MDLQMKLAADGLAAVYKSPETAALPEWAHFKDMALRQPALTSRR